MSGGWIYVFMTSTDYFRYKIGLTKNNPMLRLNQLKTGDPLIGFEVAYFIPDSLGQLSTIENMIHEQLGARIEFHSGGLSEWFRGEPRDVWVKLDIIFESLGFEVTDYFQLHEAKVFRFWEENLLSHFNHQPRLDEHIAS
jgi:hypothetical protein